LFSRHELCVRNQEYRERPLLFVEWTRIQCGSMEAEGIVHRSYKTIFEGPLHWWVNSQQVIEQTVSANERGWCVVDPEEALCEPIGEARFLELVSECLAADFFAATLKPFGRFCNAMLLRDEWSNRIAVGEFADRYYATYWLTSA
jgi:hypothetical protein